MSKLIGDSFYRAEIQALIADLNRSAHTRCNGIVGGGIHSTLSTDCFTSTAVNIAINGKQATLAANTQLDFSAINATTTVLPAGYKRYYLLSANLAGTWVCTEGVAVLAAGTAVYPELPAGNCAVRGILITNATALGFTLGTTSLNTGSITIAYEELSGGTPSGTSNIAA